MPGPLEGLRIVEIAGVGPAPFAAMMLADHGAEVIRVDRLGTRGLPQDILNRSRKSIALDLKKPEAIAIVRDLARASDGLLEGFRPGVMERLGLGPETLLDDNPRLVYGRMTGWGQDGPYAATAGHDINYIALSGVLHMCGRAGQKPTPPVNFVGDFGGGGMLMAFGMLAALNAAARTGQGQVIDCAMTEGAALLSSMVWTGRAIGMWRDERGVNILDGGAHFYDTYECADGKYISIGPNEPQFYRLMLNKIGCGEDPEFADQMNQADWPYLSEKLATIFKSRDRASWCALLEGTDACFAPVLSMAEAPHHPHNQARGVFIEVDGVTQPAPAPRFSATKSAQPTAAEPVGFSGAAVLDSLGYDPARIDALRAGGVWG